MPRSDPAGPRPRRGMDSRQGPPIPSLRAQEKAADEYEEEEEALQHQQPNAQERAAAQSSIQDFTRNIQRKKEKELAELQFIGGDTSANGHKQAINSNKVGRNDPCPCGSGKKYKKCHGA